MLTGYRISLLLQDDDASGVTLLNVASGEGRVEGEEGKEPNDSGRVFFLGRRPHVRNKI